MAKFQIPSEDKLFIQSNKSDVFGNLFATWNLDFNVNPGKVRVSNGLTILSSSVDDVDLGLPYAFVRSSADGTDRWWAACGAVLFKNTNTSSISSAFTQDEIGSSPTTLLVAQSDIIDFNGALIVTLNTEIARLSTTWNAVWWGTTLVQTALTTGVPHPLNVTKKTNYLCIGDANKMHTVDKNSNARASRVILPTEFEIIWIRSGQTETWIGARNKFTQEAEVFYWDEYAENYNRSYRLKHPVTFAGVIKDEVPYTVNGLGQLLKFTGNGFDEVAVFPVYGQANSDLRDGNTPRRNIHRNGMTVSEDVVHINIFSEVNSALASFLPRFPSGVWTYDEKQGLRHKYGISQYDTGDASELDYGAMRLGTTGAIVATQPNDGLFLIGNTVPTSATATMTAISYVQEQQGLNNRGHFISSIFESSAFEDIYKDILLTFKRFKNSGDRIIIKYRAIKNPNYPIILTGTWSDTNTFTTTTAALGSLANMAVGDEVMIIRGRGAGATAHISAVSEAGGTYTVDLDEIINANLSGTFHAVVQEYKKAAVISTQSIERQSFNLDIPGTFIQLKIELRTAPGGTALKGDSPELEKVVVNSSPEETI